VLFEYDDGFVRSGLELSPFRLPLRPGVVRGDPRVYDGLPGVFEDCLPDGWGRLLLDRRVSQLNVDPRRLGPLDRLAFLGPLTLGAIRFEPSHRYEQPSVVSLLSLEREAQSVFAGATDVDLDRLIALGGSPQGARPKVLIQRKGQQLRSEQGPTTGWTSWMVKFRARDDADDAAQVEHVWVALARSCGLETAETALLETRGTQRRHFATRRFDRIGARRLHLHGLGGLLHVPFGVPALDYRDLLRVTRTLTRDERQVTSAFRLACFNVLAGNRDDHARNVAFLMSDDGQWRLAPAFDLTPSEGPGGQHAMSVCGSGLPGLGELDQLADELAVEDATSVLSNVKRGLSRFSELAKRLGVKPPLARRLADRLHPG
jgi:serine/threonine-protein kinase HipA